MKIIPLKEIKEKTIEHLLEQEKEITLTRFLWNTTYTHKIKIQLIRYRRLEGFCALENENPLGYMFWISEDNIVVITGFFFQQNISERHESEFLEFCTDYLVNKYADRRIEGQLLYLDNEIKAKSAEKAGLEVTRREYMKIDLSEFDFTTKTEENSWSVHSLHVYSSISREFIDTLALTMYMSYQNTIDARITESFSTAEGCRNFISNIFEYPVFGEMRLDLSYIARDTGHAIIGMILVTGATSETAHITQLSVVPWYQSHGIGKTLLLESLESMKLKGFKNAILMVTTSNNRAINLYRKIGFHTISNFYTLLKN